MSSGRVDMIAPSAPDFIITTEARQAAFNGGFRLDLGLDGAWLQFKSSTAKGSIWIAAAAPEGPWLLAISEAHVAAELGAPNTINGPGAARFAYDSRQALHDAVARVYQLAVSLPDAPFKEFEQKTKALPRATEAERLVIQRVGQDVFRRALLEYWNFECPLTGIRDEALLRASHIVPWSQCESDEERLDVHNGLLLSALWDAAFDKGLVTFANDGTAIFSERLSEGSRKFLGESRRLNLATLTDKHRAYLVRHRTEVFEQAPNV